MDFTIDKVIAFFLLMGFACLKTTGQNNCFCDTTRINISKDSMYSYDDQFVYLKIAEEAGTKFLVKTIFGVDTQRVWIQVNNDNIENGESCSWNKNGDLVDRFLYEDGALKGSNNFVWYKNGSIMLHCIVQNDSIFCRFYDKNGRLSSEEVSFDGQLVIRKSFCNNGFLQEYQKVDEYPVLVLEYYCSGVLKRISHQKFNHRVGKYFEYYNDGSLKEKGVIVQKNGESQLGEKTKVKKYKKGYVYEKSPLLMQGGQ